MAFGTASSKIWDVTEHYGNPESAYNALKDGNQNFLTAREKNSVRTTHLEQCQAVIENCNKKGIRIITFYSDDYPVQLKNISNPPVVLFAKGDISVFNELCLTVVGTRQPSAYSVKAAGKICSELAKLGVVLASGFALGIDSVVHRSAITNGSRTIAVLGCGIDVDYPKENTKSKKAVETHGVFISEFLPGTKPYAPNFPKRNRILSGISSGTLVIEASQKSGALITAEFAVEQGKDLFCIPPADIFDARYSGVVRYLRDGAIPVFSHLDIVYGYYKSFTHKLSALDEVSDYYEAVSESSVFTHEKKSVKDKENSGRKENTAKNEHSSISDEKAVEEKEITIDYGNLDEEQKKIVDFLKGGIRHIDEISEETGEDIAELFVRLAEMEMDGIVRCLPGKAYELN